jgi:molybdopterin converting factor small subunit
MSKIDVRLFGAFRPLGSNIILNLDGAAKVSDVRAAFAQHIPEDLHDLLAVSRFADERAVLAEDAPLSPGACLAILPPVSGG